MTDREREDCRRRLQALAQRLRGDITALADDASREAGGAAAGGLSNVPFHPADLGTDAFEQELSSSLLENADRILGEVSAAVARLDAGTYGRCERCGAEIPAGRLRAAPYARRCVGCARAAEREGEEGASPARL
jgi:RNA polymerase-binding transcription factor DksA